MPRVLVPVTKPYENTEPTCLEVMMTCCGIFARRKDLFGYIFLEPTFHEPHELKQVKESYEANRLAAVNSYFPSNIAIAEFVVDPNNRITKCVKLHRLQQQTLSQKVDESYRPILNFRWDEREVREEDVRAETLARLNEEYQTYLRQQADRNYLLRKSNGK